MTYKEAYLQCKTTDEFRDMLERDLWIAKLFCTPGRVKAIEDAINDVLKERPEFEHVISEALRVG